MTDKRIKFDWTPERIDLLLVEHAKGTMPDVIAKMIGYPKARSTTILNAVQRFKTDVHLQRQQIADIRRYEGMEPLRVGHPLAAVMSDDEIMQKRTARGEV